jgi:3-deoxy-manno-octulosonate cytidylyltransferase (CMP-KDO synthetase)
MKAIAVIPARYGSTRFPGKPLVPIKGKPLLEWVWRGVCGSKTIQRVLIATDDERIATAAHGFGAEVAMTSDQHPSGTDRVAEAVKGLEADWIVNVQGDEPLLKGSVLDDFVNGLKDVEMGTMARKFDDPKQVANPNIVKVVMGANGRALYFSRSPIPFQRDKDITVTYWQHIGLYAYRPGVLQRLVSLPPSPLECIEKLEQLRALENGISIQVIPTDHVSIGVDTPEDVERVEKFL